MAIATSKAMGAASILGIDVNQHRLELAKAVGAGDVLDGADPDVIARVVKWSGGSGADVALEMSGNQRAIVNALRSLKAGGTLVAFGIPARPIELDLANDVILKGRNVIGILGRRMWKDWETMQRLLESGKLDLRPIVTHRFKLADFEQAMATFSNDAIKCGKVVLVP
jgi:threonine 3-dehydrogenase